MARRITPVHETLCKPGPDRSRHGTNDITMPKKIFVGSLSATTTETTLLETFTRYGSVVACHLLLDPNGQSTGGGEIEYATDQQAADAVAGKNGTLLDGQRITVQTR